MAGIDVSPGTTGRPGARPGDPRDMGRPAFADRAFVTYSRSHKVITLSFGVMPVLLSRKVPPGAPGGRSARISRPMDPIPHRG